MPEVEPTVEVEAGIRVEFTITGLIERLEGDGHFVLRRGGIDSPTDGS